jgi:hypothetical protein
VTIKAEKGKYSRKNNPAVELMKKVIAAKKLSDLTNHDYYKYDKYEKLTLAANDLTPERLQKKPYSSTPWLLDQVEECQYTNKLILPISVEETVSQYIYRKDPQSKKTIIKGQQASGVNDLFQTGDILNTVLKEVFTDVNLYDDQIRLMQYPFTSPIGKDAIAFYRFYIEDTVKIQRDSCIHLHFLPNNQMDFGFRGDIYILKDSTYHVRRCELTLPRQSSVNWVKNLRINQEFERLDNGDWVLTEDDMVTELLFAKFISEAIVIKNNRYTGYSFDELPKKLFKGKRTEIKEPDRIAGIYGHVAIRSREIGFIIVFPQAFHETRIGVVLKRSQQPVFFIQSVFIPYRRPNGNLLVNPCPAEIAHKSVVKPAGLEAAQNAHVFPRA